MKILVCGGRDYYNSEHLFAYLDKFHAQFTITELIEGDAKGADRLAGQWAANTGVKLLPFSADWTKHGKAAGSIRNQEMLDKGKPDYVIAFPGNRGTADMIHRAKKAGIKVYDGANLSW